MASFRAIHPYVRETAFRHGFVSIHGNPYRVQHPTLKGKKAQIAFYKAFREACLLPGVRIVAMPGAETGRTILFPQVSQEKWEAAREDLSQKRGWYKIFRKIKLLFHLNNIRKIDFLGY